MRETLSHLIRKPNAFTSISTTLLGQTEAINKLSATGFRRPFCVQFSLVFYIARRSCYDSALMELCKKLMKMFYGLGFSSLSSVCRCLLCSLRHH